MHRSSPFGRTLAHARREAWLVGLVWLLALAWTVGYCWLFGYAHPPQSWWVRALGALAEGQPVPVVGGMPAWVVWGIVAPGAICTLLTVLFGTVLIADDDLGEEAGP
jgi:hypothetical protein